MRGTRGTKLGEVMVDQHPWHSAISFFELFVGKRNINLNMVERKIHKFIWHLRRSKIVTESYSGRLGMG